MLVSIIKLKSSICISMHFKFYAFSKQKTTRKQHFLINSLHNFKFRFLLNYKTQSHEILIQKMSYIMLLREKKSNWKVDYFLRNIGSFCVKWDWRPCRKIVDGGRLVEGEKHKDRSPWEQMVKRQKSRKAETRNRGMGNPRKQTKG